ncbi:hypothetical protein GXP67_30710 [Rhodocytophaga rosea]|uniref:TerB family tellurite resistance protein n=1 Tax=Rhodocytophaga rosea TaxID=2704465 RepID=A0A6C0GTB7_9BACT|nr:hypothetical protein [Rhodocytophaga rosea]QHT70710.1 hypothetical protein GXP67_30710 [Rhodocytophaga rosea]
MPEIENEREAFLAIIYACMSADNHVSDLELKEMTYILSKKKLYTDINILEIYTKVQSTYQFIGYNSFKLIEMSAMHISPHLKLTIYAHAMEIFLADKNFHANERQLASYLKKVLEIDENQAAKIQEVINIKSMG